jgi:hypothetical protein
MTNKVCIFVLILYSLLLGQVQASPAIKHGVVYAKEAPVCFVDFRIDLVVGKSESDIGDDQYCRYAIDREKFLSLLTPAPASTFYMNGNVRAKVSMSAKDEYFIDYNGVVRFGDKKFQVSKKNFTNALRKLKRYQSTKP